MGVDSFGVLWGDFAYGSILVCGFSSLFVGGVSIVFFVSAGGPRSCADLVGDRYFVLRMLDSLQVSYVLLSGKTDSGGRYVAVSCLVVNGLRLAYLFLGLLFLSLLIF